MKTLLKFLPFLAFIALLVSCEKPLPPQCSHPLRESLQVDASFNTTFSKSVIPEGHIDLKGSVYQMVQTGSGSDDELGGFQINLTCYWSATDCIPGRSGGSLTDGMGNVLFIRCKECFSQGDLTAEFPLNQTHITGRFEFAGGTGRFANATGEGTIDCMVAADGQVASMSHHWTGFIKNVKLY
ncbi:hypothetical protein EG832_08940 [bacterium]|nr:hypothetical protein [bacterium]